MITFDLPGMMSVTAREVPFVDNEGQPCEGCQTEGQDVGCTLYGVIGGESVTLDRCLECVFMDLMRMDPNHPVTVEISPSAEGDLDDRMHSQDCTCVHPDAR